MKILKTLHTVSRRVRTFSPKSVTFVSESTSELGIKVNCLLQTSSTWVGQPIVYPTTKTPEVSICHIEIPPGQETGWHFHPVPSFIYVLSGRLSLETQKFRTAFQAGQVFVESIHLPHNGKNLGPEPVSLIVIYAGIKDQPHTQESDYPVRASCCMPIQVSGQPKRHPSPNKALTSKKLTAEYSNFPGTPWAPRASL